ncbi:hypothetical protein F2Q69_00039568 [Brassica cretica]|uniref:Uncharacterized protein n=1 Tax=Brassica cretica TaxID=69181 RepID=A0A8S9NBC1_BRACR|nr:hypothetical protein F2Q69_00039568 [Brassica cretica]
MSWVFKACLAVSEEETTTVGTLPSFKNITGPYFLESLHRDCCDKSPSWCKFPMIGKPGGDGGPRCCFLRFKAARRRHKKCLSFGGIGADQIFFVKAGEEASGGGTISAS